MTKKSKMLTVIFFVLGGFLLVVGVTLYQVAPSLAASNGDPEMVYSSVSRAGMTATFAGLGSLAMGLKQKLSQKV